MIQTNVDGRDEIRQFDTQTWKELPTPKLAGGSVGSTVFHPKLPLLAYSVNSAQGPSQIHLLSDTCQSTQWTKAAVPPSIDTRAFRHTEIIRWRSFDGLQISGLVNRPPSSFKGKRPVLISIHGGPETQGTVGLTSARCWTGSRPSPTWTPTASSSPAAATAAT